MSSHHSLDRKHRLFVRLLLLGGLGFVVFIALFVSTSSTYGMNLPNSPRPNVLVLDDPIATDTPAPESSVLP